MLSFRTHGGPHGQESEEGKEGKEDYQEEKEVTPPTSAIPTAICAAAALE
jgi:hypothetical protein